MRPWLKRTLAILALGAGGLWLAGSLAGCRRPEAPRLTGVGRFHDLSQIKKGMSPSDVRRIMGSSYKLIYEEGLQGADMGIYIWEYAEGRVYFNPDGALKVVPF